MDQQMFDVFEPGFIQAALDHSNKPTNLGPLIFGKDHWRGLGREVSEIEDPLTKMFCKRGDDLQTFFSFIMHKVNFFPS
jgi:hypothetical protein